MHIGLMQPDSALFAETYWGNLLADQDGSHSISIFGFENSSTQNRAKTTFESKATGTLWGFVQSGSAVARSGGVRWTVSAGQWFSLPLESGFEIELGSDETRMFAVGNSHHHGLPSMGGPVEKTGRLRYIDGCSDTILYSPPLKGDPCLNLLHFPTGVDQTQHFHPSSRCGIVSNGSGVCVFERSEVPLKKGQIFYLPKNLRHKFKTGSSEVLDVISFHPDSDWGPTHEVHPMINRTWMDPKQP